MTSYNYNRPERLSRTLSSLANQSRLPDELIISDDCSPVDASSIVDQWRASFPNIRYNRNSVNIGMPANLNLAIRMATGDYIANLHDGDAFEPMLLAKWEQELIHYPSAGFVFCGVGGWQHPTKFGNGIIVHDPRPLTSGKIFYEKYFLHRWTSIVWGTVMARRTAYDDLLPFDSRFSYISDVDMWIRMCLAWDVAYVPEPLILLDNTPTPWRAFRWDRIELMRHMQRVNIQRFYSEEPERMRRELKRHEKVAQQQYLRRLLGRLWHRDLKGVREGVRLCRNLGWPLQWLAVAGG